MDGRRARLKGATTMAAIGDLMVVNTKSTSPLNANAPATSDSNAAQVSNFVTVQSLGTFAVAVPVLKTIWKLLKALSDGWTKSYWTPLVICLLYGAWQLGISVSGPKAPAGVMPKISASVIAIANAAILAAAVIGLTATK
jgi:hypothetical protein